jgi:hypothetical protein
MILGTHGIIASQIVGIDPDWLAYYNRVIADGGSLTTTEQSATKTLVADLKAAGIWSSMKAIYPMVGASAAACKQNLKSASFTGSFSSGWTFASTGVTGDGSTAYFNSTLNPNAELSQNSCHTSFYSRTNNAVSSTIEIGSLSLGPNLFFHTHIYYIGSGSLLCLLAQDSVVQFTVANSLGFSNGNRTSSTRLSNFKNGSNLGDTTVTSVALTTQPVYIGAGNIGGSASNFSSRECAFASIGDGLTDTQASNFYTAVQAFQTTLSRQV